jgi:hypothetical protein
VCVTEGTGNIEDYQQMMPGVWHTPVSPGHRRTANPGLHSKTLSQKKKKVKIKNDQQMKLKSYLKTYCQMILSSLLFSGVTILSVLIPSSFPPLPTKEMSSTNLTCNFPYPLPLPKTNEVSIYTLPS